LTLCIDCFQNTYEAAEDTVSSTYESDEEEDDGEEEVDDEEEEDDGEEEVDDEPKVAVC